MPKRIVCADALEWLAGDCPPCSVVASPPDQNELGCSIEDWEVFYRTALERTFAVLAPGAPAVIYATDRKAEGQWHSKAAMIMGLGEAAGLRVLWHKIVLRRGVGKADIHRPGYSHLIALGDEKTRPGTATPDVIERGHMLYPNAMGMTAAKLAIEFAGRPRLPLVDPFCGRGTVPAMAEAMGLDAIGIDIDPAQCKAAEALRLRRR
ncbi:MAG: hypothetical protein Tp170SUR191951_14 [Prokaryotic dsDNA virus sp.]|nr:hypothetical protein [Pseudomonas sp.]MBS67319.1 hypothetical protein [Pseudomonas sp.]QDP55176.1 MAG: hypothetical protein Tp170SUR191951_14 [Prokaryotic dsDNA virus sp.]|tara:strand:- start:4109 stop:4729 length:621 start_codon:yes stop_codon:yes gene_type:complete